MFEATVGKYILLVTTPQRNRVTQQALKAMLAWKWHKELLLKTREIKDTV